MSTEIYIYLKTPQQLQVPRMKIVGLTGGIATGKSTVANILSSKGIPIIDLDRLARDVLQKGTQPYDAVVRQFGRQIVDPGTGQVDRKQLGQIIFSDPAQRKKLNAITHGPILRLMLKQLFCYFLVLLLNTSHDLSLFFFFFLKTL